MVAWLPGYKYRRRHTITNASGGLLTDYQVPFTVYTINGTDSVGAVYLGSDVKSNLADLRVTTSDGTTPCYYWIEGTVTNGFTVWVKIPSIPTTGCDVYLYYGKSNAFPASNGDLTFPFFDDFNGNALDTTKWTSNTINAASVANSILTCHTTVNGAASTPNITFGTNYALRARVSFTPTSTVNHNICFNDGTKWIGYLNSWLSSNSHYYTASHDSSDQGTDIGGSYTGYRILDIIRNASTNIVFKIDGSTVATHSTQVPTTNMYILLSQTTAGDGYEDWILVRKFTATEPAHSTWYGTEVAPSPLFRIKGMRA